eukprot:7254924-Pyramimonas_sp.AAC.1
MPRGTWHGFRAWQRGFLNKNCVNEKVIGGCTCSSVCQGRALLLMGVKPRKKLVKCTCHKRLGNKFLHVGTRTCSDNVTSAVSTGVPGPPIEPPLPPTEPHPAG